MSALPVALFAGLLTALGVGAVYLAFNPVPTSSGPKHSMSASGQRDLLAAVVIGGVVLFLTRWPTAAFAVIAFVVSWRWLFAT